MGSLRKALIVVGATQGIVAACVLCWAIPLFADPPILGNGVERSSDLIAELFKATQSEHRLAGVAEQFRWLFRRHSEGVLVAIGSAIVLFSSAATLFAIAFRPETSAGQQRAGI